MIARFLIDTSAAARMWLAVVAERLEPLISGGLVASCASLDAVALYSARNPEEYEHVRADRREAYEFLPTDDGHWQRTFDAQRELARTGQHRAVGIADLLTRSWATQHHMTVLHYEADFEMAAEVLPFEHRWVSRGERCGPTAHGVRRVVSEGGHGTSAHASRSAAERAASAWTQIGGTTPVLPRTRVAIRFLAVASDDT